MRVSRLRCRGGKDLFPGQTRRTRANSERTAGRPAKAVADDRRGTPTRDQQVISGLLQPWAARQRLVHGSGAESRGQEAVWAAQGWVRKRSRISRDSGVSTAISGPTSSAPRTEQVGTLGGRSAAGDILTGYEHHNVLILIVQLCQSRPHGLAAPVRVGQDDALLEAGRETECRLRRGLAAPLAAPRRWRAGQAFGQVFREVLEGDTGRASAESVTGDRQGDWRRWRTGGPGLCGNGWTSRTRARREQGGCGGG